MSYDEKFTSLLKKQVADGIEEIAELEQERDRYKQKLTEIDSVLHNENHSPTAVCLLVSRILDSEGES